MSKQSPKANFYSLLSANLIIRPFWFIYSNILLIKYLSVSENGFYAIGLYSAIFFIDIADWGLTNFITKEIANHRDNQEKSNAYINNLLYFRLFISSIILIGYYFLYLGGFFDTKILLLQVFGIFYNLSLKHLDFIRAYFRGVQQMRYEARSLITEKILVITLGSLMLLFFRTGLAVLIGMSIGMFISFLLSLKTLHRNFFKISIKYDKAFILKALSSATPYALLSLVIILNKYIGVSILQAYKGEFAVGILSISLRYLEIFILIPSLISTAYFPKLVELYPLNPKLFKHTVFKITFGGVLCSLPFVLITYFGIDYIIENYFTHYVQAIPLIKLTILFLPILSINNILCVSLMAAGETAKLTLIIAIGLCSNIIINLMSVSQFSFWGTAIAYLSAEAVIAFCFLVFFVYKYHFQASKHQAI